jgi:hypothetical protein
MSIFDEHWVAIRDLKCVATDGEGIVCVAPVKSAAHWPARSQLIAAAPDLVGALRLARRFIPDAYEADLAIVDAALTKAGVFS